MQAWNNIKTAFQLLTRKQRRRWSLLIPLGMASALMEAAAAGVIFAMAAVISDTSRVTSLPVLTLVYSHLPDWLHHEQAMMALLIGWAIAVFVAKTALTVFSLSYNNRILASDQAALATHVFRGYLDIPWAAHLGQHTADEIHRIDQSVHSVLAPVLWHAANIARHFVNILGLLVVVVFTSFLIAAASGALVGGTVVMLAFLLRRRQVELGRQADEWRRRRTRALHEGLGAIQEIQMLGRQSAFASRFEASEQELAEVEYRIMSTSALPRIINETLFLVLLIALVGLTLGGSLRSPELLPLVGLYAYAGLRLMPAGNGIIDSIGQILGHTHPLERLVADVARATPGQSFPQRNAESDAGKHTGAPVTFLRSIDLVDVSVGYTSERPVALSGMTLKVQRGEILGLVGQVGAGKSTLLHVIAGLLPPGGGRILVDGVDVAADPSAWRRQLGLVPQVPYLMDDTVRRNIAFGLADEDIDEQRIKAVVQQVGLSDLLAILPAGLDSVVGERGKHLSGGQRQRIALARALYDDPPVLLLDEPTGALDLASERQILRVLQGLRGHRTVVLVSHRPLLMRACDRLAYLHEGRLRAVGTWAELERDCEEFQRLLGKIDVLG